MIPNEELKVETINVNKEQPWNPIYRIKVTHIPTGFTVYLENTQQSPGQQLEECKKKIEESLLLG